MGEGKRVPAGPVAGRLADLRKIFTVKEIEQATGVSRFNIRAFETPGRLTVRADHAEAIMNLDASAPILKISDMERFSAARFRAVRLAKGFSQPGLEMAAGFSSGLVHHWEDGRHKPRLHRLVAAMSVLGCTFADVSEPDPGLPVDDEDEPYEPPRPVFRDDSILSPYPCGVCGQKFRSRHMLATHSHRKKAST